MTPTDLDMIRERLAAAEPLAERLFREHRDHGCTWGGPDAADWIMTAGYDLDALLAEVEALRLRVAEVERERDDYHAKVTRLRAALDSASLEERARIVEDLRDTSRLMAAGGEPIGATALRRAAAAIEAGAHLEPRT